MTRVSAIIPVYNGEEYICEAVDSAIAQTHKDTEVIVVDDGSTDSTPKLLAAYGDRIRVLTQVNGGHVNARNNGSKIATGEWFAFLDGDDVWRPEKLEKQLEVACDDTGLIYTDRENFGETDRVTVIQSDTLQHFEGDIFEPMLRGNFITVASTMMRKDWFERLGAFDERLKVCEDWDMWLRFSAEGGLTKVVREPLTLYRRHSDSMSNKQFVMRDGRRTVLQNALSTKRGQSLPRRERKKAMSEMWKCSAWHMRPSSRLMSVVWYSRAAACYPLDLDTYKQIVKSCVAST